MYGHILAQDPKLSLEMSLPGGPLRGGAARCSTKQRGTPWAPGTGPPAVGRVKWDFWTATGQPMVSLLPAEHVGLWRVSLCMMEAPEAAGAPGILATLADFLFKLHVGLSASSSQIS